MSRPLLESFTRLALRPAEATDSRAGSIGGAGGGSESSLLAPGTDRILDNVSDLRGLLRSLGKKSAQSYAPIVEAANLPSSFPLSAAYNHHTVTVHPLSYRGVVKTDQDVSATELFQALRPVLEASSEFTPMELGDITATIVSSSRSGHEKVSRLAYTTTLNYLGHDVASYLWKARCWLLLFCLLLHESTQEILGA